MKLTADDRAALQGAVRVPLVPRCRYLQTPDGEEPRYRLH